ncbi:MAG: ATP-binding cassette domain-containing protein [Oscillospiraceae bacterium]|nr:ATP-binding cassette domain-containing protein [Oscillospiraceae bacterium]
MSEQTALLELKKLKKYFPVRRGVSIKAVEDVSFTIYQGEKFGVVGESGCGKSTLGRVILQLYPQTSGAAVYYGQMLEEVGPKYLEHEVSMLMDYQTKASTFYQKSLELDRRAAALQKEKDALSALGVTNREVKKEIRLSKKISRLQFRSKELRKDASRHLREGSRTVGSLILCKDLPKVAELFRKANKETAQAAACSRTLQALEHRCEHLALENKADPSILRRIEALRADAAEHVAGARAYRRQAWDEYHGKDILPITERTQDPAYQAKLDGNYETGINLGKLTRGEMRRMRREMQMIFQDPAASLDPRQTVGKSIEEVFVIHSDLTPLARKERTMALLEEVGLKREHYYSYPHTLSGGQKQRVGIARAIALNPKFIVLDESVSALDVSVQAQILQLLGDLSRKKGLTYFFITHDLGVVKHFCDRIVVMYLGSMCEIAHSCDLFRQPLHPYTESLLAAVPRLRVGEHSTELVLEGDVPSAMNPPKGCPFHTRCAKCMEICSETRPVPREIEPGHIVACHLYDPAEA